MPFALTFFARCDTINLINYGLPEARFRIRRIPKREGASVMVEGLVSVITPCYNGEKYLAETVRSVLGQTYAHWEMYIVDDGSTDGSARIAEEFAAGDSRVHLIRQANAGSASARNAGIRRAQGRYIALLDADDLWEPAFLEKQLAFMAGKGAECICCSYMHINEHSEEIQHPTIARPVITVRDMRVMNQIGCLTGLYDTARHGKVYLREELKSLRDDYAYWYDVVKLTGRAYGNTEVLARYRVLANSTTGRKLNLVLKQFRFYRKYLNEGILTAAVNTLRWGIRGLGKFS